MEVEGVDKVDACVDQEIGERLGGDGDAGLVFAELAGVAEKRDDGGDAGGAGAAGGVDQDEELHEVLVRGGAGGLDDEDVAAADVLVDFHEGLAIGEGADGGVAEGHADVIGDALREFAVGGAGENLEFVILHGSWSSWSGTRRVGDYREGGIDFNWKNTGGRPA